MNADDEYSFALLGNSVLNSVNEFMAHGIADVSEGLHYYLESVSVLMCGEAAHIFNEEHLWLGAFEKDGECQEEFAAWVVQSEPFARVAERLTRHSTYEDINIAE